MSHKLDCFVALTITSLGIGCASDPHPGGSGGQGGGNGVTATASSGDTSTASSAGSGSGSGGGGGGIISGTGGTAPAPLEWVTKLDASKLQFPDGLAMNATGDTAYVSLVPTGQVLSINIADGKVSDFGSVPPFPATGVQATGLVNDSLGNFYVGVASSSAVRWHTTVGPTPWSSRPPVPQPSPRPSRWPSPSPASSSSASTRPTGAHLSGCSNASSTDEPSGHLGLVLAEDVHREPAGPATATRPRSPLSHMDGRRVGS